MNEYGNMLLLIAKEGDTLNKVTCTGYPNLHPPTWQYRISSISTPPLPSQGKVCQRRRPIHRFLCERWSPWVRDGIATTHACICHTWVPPTVPSTSKVTGPPVTSRYYTLRVLSYEKFEETPLILKVKQR